MPAYATTGDLREYLGGAAVVGSDAPNDDVTLAVVLDEASAYVDLGTNRLAFGPKLVTVGAQGASAVDPDEARSEREPREFYGEGTRWMRVSPCYADGEAEPIEVYDGEPEADNLLASSAYRLVYTKDRLSVYMLERLDGRCWLDGCVYAVRAFYGCKETPPAVKRTVLELAATRVGAGGQSSAPFEAGGGTVEAPPPVISAVIDKYIAEYRLSRI